MGQTLSWLYNPMVLDAIGLGEGGEFLRPTVWCESVQALARAIGQQAVQALPRGVSGLYVPPAEQNRVLGLRWLSANILQLWVNESRTRITQGLDLLPMPAPATDDEEKAAVAAFGLAQDDF